MIHRRGDRQSLLACFTCLVLMLKGVAIQGGSSSSAARTHAAICWVGAPRGLLDELQYSNLNGNLRDATLLGLAPKHGSVDLTIFGLFHLQDQGSEGNGQTPSVETLDREKVKGAIQDIAAVEKTPHLHVGELRFTTDSSCSSAAAQRVLPCCAHDSHAPAKGLLQAMWVDECFSMVVAHEERQSQQQQQTSSEVNSSEGGVKQRFDWVVRARPDLVCAQPLPSLSALPLTHVYSTVKEFGTMWDVLFLIPRSLLADFRTALMAKATEPLTANVKSKEACRKEAVVNRDPSLALMR